MKPTLYILIILTVLSLFSCDKNAHQDEYEYNVSVGLVMKTPDPVVDTYLWAFDTDGILRYEFSFATPQELASATLPLPEGNYTLIACNHLSDAFDRETEIGSTRLSDLHITQSDANASPEHAHYGMTEISIPYGLEGWQWVEAEVTLSRILAELQVSVSDLPEEVSSATAVVANCASGFFPAENRLDDIYAQVHLGDALKDGNTGMAVFNRIRLMPTIAMTSIRSDEADSDAARTRILLTLHYMHGGPDMVIRIEMPPLLNGGVYEVDIPYKDIHPGIILQITDINGWKDATPIYGEILNPE